MSKVNHPQHYNRGKVEVSFAMDLLFPHASWRSHAFKYAARAFSKGQVKQDLEKALWCARHVGELDARSFGDSALVNGQQATTLVDAVFGWVVEAADANETVTAEVRALISAVHEFMVSLALHDDTGADEFARQLESLSKQGVFADPTLWKITGPPSTLSDQVRVFQQLIKRAAPDRPTTPTEQVLHLKLRLIAEEFFELLDACLPDDQITACVALRDEVFALIGQAKPSAVKLGKVADALADIDFVSEGMRQELGIDGEPIAALVAAANITKASGPDDPVTGKRLKPKDFVPPDIDAEIQRQRSKEVAP